MNNRDHNRNLEKLRQSIALGQLMPKLEPWMNRPATMSESATWEAAYRKALPADGFDFAVLPRGAGFLRASSSFGCPRSCVTSIVSDHMRLEALLAGNLSGSTEKSRSISGLALPYMKPSITRPGETATIFARGAFTKDLRENPAKKVYYEHGFGRVIGSVSAGTARIFEDNDGLHFEAIAPATSWADDLLVSMRRGDTKESGTVADPTEAHWETRSGARVRVVDAARLLLVAVVSFSTFDSTTAKVKPDSLAAAAARLAKLQGGVYGSRF